MTTHTIDREEVMAWLDGELEPSRMRVIEAHVNACGECRELAGELRQVSARFATWLEAAAPVGLANVKQGLMASTNTPAAGSWWMGRGMFSAPRWAVGVVAVLAVAVVATALQFTRSSMRFANEPEVIGAARVENRAVVGGRLSAAGAPPAEPVGPPTFRPGEGQQRKDFRAQQGQGGGGGSGAVTMPRSVEQPASDRMIVRTASVSLISDRFDQIRESLERLVASHQSRVTSLNATGDPSSRRSLRATIAVPAARMDALLTGLRSLGKVQDESLGSDDVTESFRDLGLRTANARREEQRLVELLSRRAGDLADVLAVERELARVRLEIERMDAETRATRQRVDLATVALTVQEQYRADLALGPLPLPVRFKNALVDGLRQASESLVGAAIVVLQIAPTLMVWMLILAWPARWAWRRVRA